MRPERSPWIVDTTLRDGEQAPGVVFSSGDRLKIAEAIIAAGVHEIEAGTSAMGDEAIRSIRSIASLDPSVCTSVWCRAREADLESAARCDVPAVHVSIPSSALHMRMHGISESAAVDLISDMVYRARSMFDFVSVGAQDASRADSDFLRVCMFAADQAHADRFRLADTVGLLDPLATGRLIALARRHAGHMEIGFHAHNDLGMATANALTALSCGADSVDVTVNGLGERAGNAVLAEVLMALHVRAGGCSPFGVDRLAELSALVETASGRRLESGRPVVGTSAFEHESGIHVAAVLREPSSYEPFDPELCGRQRRVIVGYHSGSSAVSHALAGVGVQVGREDAAAFVPVVRSRVADCRHAIAPDELRELWGTYAGVAEGGDHGA